MQIFLNLFHTFFLVENNWNFWILTVWQLIFDVYFLMKVYNKEHKFSFYCTCRRVLLNFCFCFLTLYIYLFVEMSLMCVSEIFWRHFFLAYFAWFLSTPTYTIFSITFLILSFFLYEKNNFEFWKRDRYRPK